jgi:transposase
MASEQVNDNLGRLSDFEKGYIVGQRQDGKTYKEIAEGVKRPWTTVVSYLKRYEARGQNHHHQNSPGGPSKMTFRTKRHILREIKNNRKQNYRTLRDKAAPGLSTRTVKRYLRSENIKKWRAKKRPKLTEELAKARLL